MSVAIFFRKAQEDEHRVVYVFGLSRKYLTRSMTVDKATSVATPNDGAVDEHFEATIVKIRRLVVGGRWPDRGVCAML
jgi:hypothetical protein